MSPSNFLGWFLDLWLTAILVLIFYRILTGQMSIRGLLSIDGNRFSPERFQMLLITVGLLGTYVSEALSSRTMPALPSELVGVLAASHVLYVGGKIAGR